MVPELTQEISDCPRCFPGELPCDGTSTPPAKLLHTQRSNANKTDTKQTACIAIDDDATRESLIKNFDGVLRERIPLDSWDRTRDRTGAGTVAWVTPNTQIAIIPNNSSLRTGIGVEIQGQFAHNTCSFCFTHLRSATRISRLCYDANNP
jgi:hypothetical protein